MSGLHHLRSSDPPLKSDGMWMAFLPTSFFVTRSQKSAQRPPHEEQEIALVRSVSGLTVRLGQGRLRVHAMRLLEYEG